jgi:Bacterial PH domain
MQRFPAAPWSTLLKVTSAASTLILAGVSYAAWRAAPAFGFAHTVGNAVAWVPISVALGALLFVVTGYEVDAQQIRVGRLLWATTFPLTGLSRAWKDPDVIKGSLRVVGNGGLFSFSGLFWSRRLGRYRLYATDLKRSVVLVTPERILVVSPEDPDEFLRHIQMLFPEVQGRVG